MVGRKADTRTYHPIDAYGVIGECHSVVLVAPDGSIDWGCLPDFDSPAIFCRLLDAEQAATFKLLPFVGAKSQALAAASFDLLSLYPSVKLSSYVIRLRKRA